ncbi:MAG: LysM domain-containing protein [Actinomycetota bacterium]
MSGSHIVEPGDTLSGIADKYQLKLEDLVRWNKIENPDLITVGQKIELSGHEEAPGDQTYIVQSGDTLTAIAEKFDVSTADLGAYNKLENLDVITAGQELIIPAQGVTG